MDGNSISGSHSLPGQQLAITYMNTQCLQTTPNYPTKFKYNDPPNQVPFSHIQKNAHKHSNDNLHKQQYGGKVVRIEKDSYLN